MPNPIHEANRSAWDARARNGSGQVDQSRHWRDCYSDPNSYFLPIEIDWLGDVTGKQVCVLGSGDNLAVFALAGLGAAVTSVDISAEQLRIAAERAAEVGAAVDFVCADVTDLSDIAAGSFDLVYTGGHVAIWVSDLRSYYREAIRILKPSGTLIVNEYHPFRRGLWPDTDRPYRYFDRGPFEFDKGEYLPDATNKALPAYEFHWTVSDYASAVLSAGAELLALDEVGDGSEAWEGVDLRGLPLCLLIHARKKK